VAPDDERREEEEKQDEETHGGLRESGAERIGGAAAFEAAWNGVGGVDDVCASERLALAISAKVRRPQATR
jgi:hypothetical protein